MIVHIFYFSVWTLDFWARARALTLCVCAVAATTTTTFSASLRSFECAKRRVRLIIVFIYSIEFLACIFCALVRFRDRRIPLISAAALLSIGTDRWSMKTMPRETTYFCLIFYISVSVYIFYGMECLSRMLNWLSAYVPGRLDRAAARTKHFAFEFDDL